MSVRPTLQDVADAAGVSRSTASKALNETGTLTDQTRQRVRNVANKMAYRLNSRHNNSQSRAAILGVVLGETGDTSLWPQFVMSLTTRAAELGALVTLTDQSNLASLAAAPIDCIGFPYPNYHRAAIEALQLPFGLPALSAVDLPHAHITMIADPRDIPRSPTGAGTAWAHTMIHAAQPQQHALDLRGLTQQTTR